MSASTRVAGEPSSFSQGGLFPKLIAETGQFIGMAFGRLVSLHGRREVRSSVTKLVIIVSPRFL